MSKSKVTPIAAARPHAALAKLMRSCGLDPKRAAEHGLVALAPSEVEDLVGRRHEGIGFLYHALDGTPLGVGRVRLCDPVPTTKDGEPIRYLQPTGSVPRLYLPQGHGINWAALAEQGSPVLVITEGEKKAHAGCAAGVPTVGIGGVWMGAKKKANGKLLLPELRAVVGKTKHACVAYDSDKVSNEQVLKAEQELLALLRGVSIEARSCTISPAVDGGKQGLDDYLLAEGKGQMKSRMRALLEGAVIAADLNDEWVAERNEHWVYVENPGNEPYVLIDGVTRLRLGSFEQTFSAKRAAFSQLGKLTEQSEGWLWRHHPRHKAAVREVFHTTSGPVPEGCLNRYTPPSKPEGYKAVSLAPIHAFVRSIVSPEEQRWLYTWVAYAVQSGLRAEWNVFCWSNLQGAGKTFLGKLLGACFTPYGQHLTTADILRGTFGTKWFEHRRYLLVDEGDSSEQSGRRLEELLKHASSAGHLTVEDKYQPSREIENRALIYLASNHQMTRHVSRDDRRTFLLHLTTSAPTKIAKAADALLHERPGDRTSPFRHSTVWALWQYFSRYKLHEAFDPVRAPGSQAKKNAIESGLSEREAIVTELFEHGVFCDHAMPEVVTTKQLAFLALEGRVNVAKHEYVGEAIRLGRILAASGAACRVVKVGARLERLWAVRNVESWKRKQSTAWAAENTQMPVASPV